MAAKISKEDYEDVAKLLWKTENQLGNLATGIRFHASGMHLDIESSLRGLSGTIRKEAEKARKLKEKYERKAKSD